MVAARSFRASATFFFALAIVGLCHAQAGKIEALPPNTDPAVPEAIRRVLETRGYRITIDGTNPTVEVWYRKEVPKQPKDASADAVYDRLVPSSLIGILHFLNSSTDYRGQSIAPGYYTLRYALMPNDGNHLGVAPSRDFFLLVPAKSDPGPEAAPKIPDLIALSQQASGTKHPAPLCLVPAEASSAPAITKDDEGHSIFTSTIRLASGDEIPLALVVKGTAPQ
jgi:hypothetical protein